MATAISTTAYAPFPDFARAMEHLVGVTQQLSLAKDLQTLVQIVLCEARVLTGADGAAFILRDGDKCFYVDENAIGPLWRGSRFPMDACISGWAIRNREGVVVDAIERDERAQVEMYRDTFVRSMMTAPIRKANPVGAISCYWATSGRPAKEQLKLLQSLAESTAVAMDNVTLQLELQERVNERTAQLAAATQEIHELSLKDNLTGLYNRRGFTVLAEQQLRLASRNRATTWVLVADVDGLKAVNDALGRTMGDKQLATAAKVLREAFRGHDVVARIGSDEFAVFGMSEKLPADFDGRLQLYIDAYNASSDDQVPLTMSFGMARSKPGEKIVLDDLFKQAEEAMNKAQRSRRRIPVKHRA